MLRRSERLAAMAKMLSDRPYCVLPLAEFAERFGAAKSSISEDLAIIRSVFEKMGARAGGNPGRSGRWRALHTDCEPGKNTGDGADPMSRAFGPEAHLVGRICLHV